MIKTTRINVTADELDFDVFANELGYQPMIRKSDAELALLTPPIAIEDTLKPNPLTRIQYVQEFLQQAVTDIIAKEKIAAIQRQSDASKEAEKVAMRAAVANAVTSTIV
jgi:hypothetical protein